MSLRDKYAYAISTAKGKFDSSAKEEGGKLHFVGSVKSENDKNDLWNAIKTIPDWRNEVIADITVTRGRRWSNSGTSSRRRDIYRQGRRHPEQDCQAASRRRKRVHEDFRAQSGSVDQPGPDQARAGVEAALTRRVSSIQWSCPKTEKTIR